MIVLPRKNFPLSGSNLSDSLMKKYSTEIYFSVLPTYTNVFPADPELMSWPIQCLIVAVPLNKSLEGLRPKNVLTPWLIHWWNSVAGATTFKRLTKEGDPSMPKHGVFDMSLKIKQESCLQFPHHSWGFRTAVLAPELDKGRWTNWFFGHFCSG